MLHQMLVTDAYFARYANLLSSSDRYAASGHPLSFSGVSFNRKAPKGDAEFAKMFSRRKSRAETLSHKKELPNCGSVLPGSTFS